VRLGIALIVVGLTLAAAAALAWTGRWRRWAGRVILGPLPAPITLFPVLAVWLVVLGLVLTEAIASRSPLTAVALVLLVLGLVLYLWAPRWWGPRWYRRVEAPHRA
jgi:uncharacterized membrane protein